MIKLKSMQTRFHFTACNEYIMSLALRGYLIYNFHVYARFNNVVRSKGDSFISTRPQGLYNNSIRTETSNVDFKAFNWRYDKNYVVDRNEICCFSFVYLDNSCHLEGRQLIQHQNRTDCIRSRGNIVIKMEQYMQQGRGGGT